MCDISKSIATRLKELRKSRQLTLEELAEKSGVSKSMLGEIERARTNPTINVLWKIANALKTPLTTLINEEKAPFTVVRKSEHIIFNQESGHVISGIFPYYEQHRMEILELVLAAGSTLSNPGHMKGVEEYLLVAEGSVTVEVAGKQILLNKDDAIRFAADTFHEINNIAAVEAKLFNIICYGS